MLKINYIYKSKHSLSPASRGITNNLLQLLHVHFLTSLAFIDLLNDVPENLDFLFFRFKLLIHLCRAALIISLGSEHHLMILHSTASNPKGTTRRALDAIVSILVLSPMIFHGLRHSISFKHLLLECEHFSLHTLVHLSPLFSFFLLLLALPFILLLIAALFNFTLLIFIGYHPLQFFNFKLTLHHKSRKLISLVFFFLDLLVSLVTIHTDLI